MKLTPVMREALENIAVKVIGSWLAIRDTKTIGEISLVTASLLLQN